MTQWDDAMRLALAQAAQAETWGDVPVGAVVLDAAGQVISQAGNRRIQDDDPLGHAELVALREASQARRSETRGNWRLDGCTIVVTLEPCAMCAGAIAQARLARLVFGAFDPKAGAIASVLDVLRDPRLPHRPEVISGVLAQDCEAQLKTFFDARRAGDPLPLFTDRIHIVR